MARPKKKFFYRIEKTFVQVQNAMYEVVQKKMFKRKSMSRCLLSAFRTKLTIKRLVAV